MDPLRVPGQAAAGPRSPEWGQELCTGGSQRSPWQPLPSQGRRRKRPLPRSPATHTASVSRPAGRVARPHVLHLRRLLGAGPLRFLPPHPRPPELHQARARPRPLAAPQEWPPGGRGRGGVLRRARARPPPRRPRPSRAPRLEARARPPPAADRVVWLGSPRRSPPGPSAPLQPPEPPRAGGGGTQAGDPGPPGRPGAPEPSARRAAPRPPARAAPRPRGPGPGAPPAASSGARGAPRPLRADGHSSGAAAAGGCRAAAGRRARPGEEEARA